MENATNTLQKNTWFLCLILAPVLLFIAQFFWQNGVLTNTAGWLQVLAYTCWIPAFQAMFFLLEQKMPRYAVIGFVVAVYACIGGNNFGVDGIYGEAFGIQDVAAKNELHSKLGLGAVLALFLPGILFPLSLLLLAINLYRTKSVEPWLAVLLLIAAIGFPLSRIPREPLLAHVDNILLIASHSLIALRVKNAKN